MKKNDFVSCFSFMERNREKTRKSRKKATDKSFVNDESLDATWNGENGEEKR